MEQLFDNGRAVDIVLAVIALEFVALLVRARPDSRRMTAVNLFFTLAPGVCILLALRAALTDAGWVNVALWLSVSFPVHVGDLLRRRP